jgi:uncharacterized phage protein (TIGR01671 family)
LIPKYRAWNKEEEMMLTFDDHWELGEFFLGLYPDDDFWDLMLATGGKDKDGETIFEGDIISRDCNEGLLVVRFGQYIENDSLGYKIYSTGFYFETRHEDEERTFSLDSELNYLCKVIGNVYENEYLLEEWDEKTRVDRRV